MALLLALFALFVTLSGLYGLVKRDVLFGWIGRLVDRRGIWPAVAIRIVLAVLLLASGPVSRTPTVFWILGLVALVAAATLPFVGRRRVLSVLDRLNALSAGARSALALLMVAFGVFVLWSVWPAL